MVDEGLLWGGVCGGLSCLRSLALRLILSILREEDVSFRLANLAHSFWINVNAIITGRLVLLLDRL